jgi:hypothetical protein
MLADFPAVTIEAPAPTVQEARRSRRERRSRSSRAAWIATGAIVMLSDGERCAVYLLPDGTETCVLLPAE